MNVLVLTTAVALAWIGIMATPLVFPANRKFGGRTSYHGKAVNWAVWYAFQAAERMLAHKRFGGEREFFRIYQGCWSGASASAGTHKGTGTADISAFNWKNRVWVFRLLGFAVWMRPFRKGVWVQHIHMVMCGDGGAARLALQQVTSFWKRPSRDGLAGNRVDTQVPKMQCRPLYVFPIKEIGRPGWFLCNVTCGAYEQQTTKAVRLDTVDKGEKWEIVAVTRDRDTRDLWGVTTDGKCIFLDNFQRAA